MLSHTLEAPERTSVAGGTLGVAHLWLRRRWRAAVVAFACNGQSDRNPCRSPFARDGIAGIRARAGAYAGAYIIKIVVPAALARIAVGLRFAVGIALVVAVPVEIVVNPQGQG